MNNSKKWTVLSRRIKEFSLLLVVLSLLILNSCVSSSTSVQVNEIPSLAENKSRIFFYRTKLLFGSGMKPAIYLNGKKVGFSISGTAFYVDVDPGKHKVSVAKIMYPGTPGGVDLEVRGNELAYVRTWTGGASFGGQTDAALATPERAKEQIAQLKILKFNIEE